MSPRPEPVVILCGGRGTRLQEQTQSIPKPLVEVGGEPIVGHVIRIYAAQGFERFLLLTGYKGDLIAEYVDASDWPGEVECVPTGDGTPTGGRIALIADRVRDGRFLATYADGVADVDLGALVDHHADRGRLATMTVVRPELQFGVARIASDGRVQGFVEKPRADQWVNGGFFCFEPGVLDYIGGDDVLERAPFERLAADAELQAFRHDGFWDCMDTWKDVVLLNDLWERGAAPWRIWERTASGTS